MSTDFIPADDMTLEMLESHLVHHHSYGDSPQWLRGQRKPNKWQYVSAHNRAHADGEYDHTHTATKLPRVTITRTLKDAHIRISEWTSSSRVSGWGNRNEGLEVEAMPTGEVKLQWRASTSIARKYAEGEVEKREAEQYARATEALEAKGLKVEPRTKVYDDRFDVTRQDNFLIVSR